MPPALSDDEGSDVSGVGAVTTPPPAKRGKKISSYADSDNSDDDAASDGASKKRKSTTRANGNAASAKAPKAKEPEEKDEEDEDDEDEEDEDMDGDEYEVEKIIGHMLDDDRNPRFRVKWKGYDDPADYTWEPEDNLADNATEILNEYFSRIGGREKLYEKPAKGKKRGRPSAASVAASTPTSATTKRARKSDVHPVDRESPSVAVAKPFKPPAGSWEDDVVDVEMFRDNEGELKVFLTWKNGEKTQHPAQQSYMRCPQKILRFYESRISFKAAQE